MTAPHLLLIEDDPDLARTITFDLEDAGFCVSHASSAMAGLMRAREDAPDLVLLDLGLPDFDGSLVVERLCRTTDVPIIALTARDAPGEKVRLLNLGVRDYVVKPFQVPELVARVRVQLRPRHEPRLVVGELEVHLSRQQARYQGRDLNLSQTEFELLALLMEEPGRVYSRAHLFQALRPGRATEQSNVMDVHLANLREKLRQRGAYRVLLTVRGAGYAVREEAHAVSGASARCVPGSTGQRK